MDTPRPDPGLLGVLWAIVLLQGAITSLSVVEAVIGGLAFGSIGLALPVIALTLTGAVLALASARGLRLRRRWARRVTMVAEWLVLATGLLNLLLTGFLAAELLGPVPVLTTIGAPIVVLVMLHRTKVLFLPSPEPAPRAMVDVVEEHG